MQKPIVRDVIFLGQKSLPASPEDIPAADDLTDTLRANQKICVGLAANMIGVKRRIIAFSDNGVLIEMFNPEIIKKSGEYTAEEGCLSLEGTRTATRYHTIKVQWQDRAFQTRTGIFTGWTAQIIQHEIDHCNGVLI